MPKRLVFPNVSSRFSSNFRGSTLAQSDSSHAPATFSDGLPLPKVFVFDLDYTLWPFWVDTHVATPIKPADKENPSQSTAMVDRYGESFSFYHEVPGILYAAKRKGITMGLASRTHTPDLAEKMLRGIIIPTPPVSQSRPQSQPNGNGEVAATTATGQEKPKEKPLKAWEYFQYREMYPGSKIKHFNRIQAQTMTAAKKGKSEEVAFADMIFFDDEGRNREVESQLGVTFVLVRDGVTKDEVDRGVREWRRRRGISTNVDSDVEEQDNLAELEG